MSRRIHPSIYRERPKDSCWLTGRTTQIDDPNGDERAEELMDAIVSDHTGSLVRFVNGELRLAVDPSKYACI